MTRSLSSPVAINGVMPGHLARGAQDDPASKLSTFNLAIRPRSKRGSAGWIRARRCRVRLVSPAINMLDDV